MEGFLFLFAVSILWVLFATVQDLKTREVANWLTFSLIAVALAFRVSIGIFLGTWGVLLWGLIGGAVFVGCAYAFYYGRVFAGGDAKLLMGLGLALPYQSLDGLLTWGSAFLFALFFCGAIYTLVYSIRLVTCHWDRFRKTFRLEFLNQRWLFALSVVLSGILAFFASGLLWMFGSVFLFAIPILYAYLQSVERACMIRLMKPEHLREGDWLLKSVHVAGKTIDASVHGLSLKEIMFLQTHKKSAIIKEGVPFVPAFLFAYGIMVFFVIRGGPDLSLLSSILSFLVQAS